MPANLTPEAQAKLAKYSEAKTIEEKIRALEEFLSVAPKHKGAENLLLWAKRRLAELREQLEEEKRKRRSRGGGGPRIFIEKEGAAQVAIIGPPNTGKSMLVHKLTGARTRVADYPFSTVNPVPGMLPYKDIYFQLIDTPPLSESAPQYIPRIVGIARNADAIIIVVGLDEDPLQQYIYVRDILAEHGVFIEKPKGTVRIEKGGEHGIQVLGNGRIIDGTVKDVEVLLARYRIYRAKVYIEGEVTLDDIEMAIFRSTVYKPAIVLANKADLPGAAEKYRKLYSYLASRRERSVWLIPVSARTGLNLDKIGEALFKRLDIIRVYTKKPNSEPTKTPVILRRGATVRDLAEHIHSDFLEYFLYAKVWGPSAKYPGERVGLDHVLEDGDIVEIHTRK
ncbi:OBG GTPase family GTP-binding protein [Hyperthermus butylicus]|uniref:GTPase n=1 Tax=Hyperthermus butylicus (strain DSM 5456 / JCM 9403 / PLM1-5) TaxID=415426 RepID=A2BJU9_HYPBU|nr:TGS domain-containing protein [Hyperthermus butylicus]ABM80260.1 putative GTPase [Hyperthermus butylicus DSM 5456]